MNGLPNAYYGYSSPPDIYKNLAITGSRVQEAPSKGAAGDVRAWDVRHRQAGLDLPFHSAPRREIPRHLGRRRLEAALRRQYLEHADGR